MIYITGQIRINFISDVKLAITNCTKQSAFKVEEIFICVYKLGLEPFLILSNQCFLNITYNNVTLWSLIRWFSQMQECSDRFRFHSMLLEKKNLMCTCMYTIFKCYLSLWLEPIFICSSWKNSPKILIKCNYTVTMVININK